MYFPIWVYIRLDCYVSKRMFQLSLGKWEGRHLINEKMTGSVKYNSVNYFQLKITQTKNKIDGAYRRKQTRPEIVYKISAAAPSVYIMYSIRRKMNE